MDAVLLSRIQFAFTVAYHYLYVPLSIGLAVLIAVIEFKFYRTREEVYDRMGRFWTKILAINFAIGVATGITMEFQFGSNWSNYSRFVGDIFGAPLAAEGVFAFFLESTFIGLLIFGRDKITRFMRFFAALMVALGTHLSAFWIVVANSWQQTPAGFKIEGGRAILTDFGAAVFNPSTLPRFLHTVTGAYITAAFVVMGISAYYLLKNANKDVAKHSMRLALIFGLIFGSLQFYLGDVHAKQVAETQPVKLAAFEALWETKEGAPLLLFGIPDGEAETNKVEIGIPGLLSFLVHGDFQAPVRGLKEFPEELRPPLAPTFWSFRIMIALGIYMALVLLLGLYHYVKGSLYTHKSVLKLMLYSIPAPYLANELGWMAAEVGRQPWIVDGLLKTSDAISPLPAGQILLTISLFAVVYALLFAVFMYLMIKEVKKPLSSQKPLTSSVEVPVQV
ncbi:cytochrome D ubiquinol oxidase subunit I [Clostridiales bacterium PH28_bin88]|nr:cytochrome D ubiquinol oxidase subunit I [Clostridiales bacterium PH28_bin88]